MEIENQSSKRQKKNKEVPLNPKDKFDVSYYLDYEKIVKMEKNYDELYYALLNNVENLNPLICLLYGYTGNGRKTCVRYCIKKVQEEFD